MLKSFWVLVGRDISLALREGGAISTALGFYLIVISILPLGLGPNLELLAKIAPGILWVSLLLSALLSVDRIFYNDYEDGSLEVMALGPLPLELVVVAKSMAHWITNGIPLALIAPLLGILLNLDMSAMWILVLTMLIGTPAVSFLGAIGAALTLGLRRGGLLLSLLILPLYTPLLIFGISTIDTALFGPGSYVTPLLILTAIMLVTLVISPLAAAAALRMNLSS